MAEMTHETGLAPVKIGIPRTMAAERAIMRMTPGVMMILAVLGVMQWLNFRPSAVSNRIADYSLAVAMIPIAAAGLVLTYHGLKWLTLALWPAWVGIVADSDGLTLRLGPFGRTRYALDRLDIRYPFEIADQLTPDDDMIYEAHLDPAEQLDRLMPRIRYPGESDTLDRRLKIVTRIDEKTLADALRPFIEYARRPRTPTKTPTIN